MNRTLETYKQYAYYIKVKYLFHICRPALLRSGVSQDLLLGRWRLTLELFGRVFIDDVGAEPGSIIAQLGGFPVKEAKFRREMEKLRNCQQRDLNLTKVRVFLCFIFIPSPCKFRI